MTSDKYMIKDNLKVIQRKGLKLSTDELDMRGVPSLVGMCVKNDSHEIEAAIVIWHYGSLIHLLVLELCCHYKILASGST